MNVLYISRPIAPPWNEGSKKLAWQLASGLTRHQAHLLTVIDADLGEPTPFTTHPIYTDSSLTVQQKGRLLRFLWQLPPNIDLLHAYFVPTPITSRLLCMVKKRHALPIIQSVPALPKLSLSQAEARQLFCGDKTIVYTAETARVLKQLGVQSVVHVNTGIKTTDYQSAAASPTLKNQLGIKPNEKILLYAGEYTRLGAVEWLRQLLPQLLAACGDCHFIFACRNLIPEDGTVKAGLQALVKKWRLENRIHFLGEVDDFPGLLKLADLFLFPVTEMGGKIDTPLTLIEAMAAGTAVLATDISPLKDAFSEESIRLIPPHHNEWLIEETLALLNDDQARQKLAKRGQQFALERFSLSSMIAAYEAIYDEFE